ncbi:MAG TPA: hypothetical protein VK469_16700, partial [Candidatus Kapabacteria bacterium]|nr:hypothetical protein [Candidatus Kapabacteria bacterium]
MKKNIKGLLFFIILFPAISFSIPLSAQNYHDIGIPFIRNYTPDDYHAGGQNWGVIQDRRGVMYFANQSGVLEFDGKYWNLLELPNKSRVRSLAIDALGTIYVTATGEFGYLASDANGKLTYVSLVNKLKKEDSKFYDVWDAVINSLGVYFITPNKIFRWHQDKIKVIPLQKKSIRSATAYDEIFISYMGGDLGVIRNDKVIPLPGCGIFAAKEYGSIYISPYPDEQLIILTKKGDFFLYDLKMLRKPGLNSFDFSRQDVPASILKPFPSEISRYIDPDHNGRLGFKALTGNRFAVCTKNGGLIIMNRDGHLLQVINKKR